MPLTFEPKSIQFNKQAASASSVSTRWWEENEIRNKSILRHINWNNGSERARPGGISRGLAVRPVSFEELLLCSVVNLNIFCSICDFSSKFYVRGLLSSTVVIISPFITISSIWFSNVERDLVSFQQKKAWLVQATLQTEKYVHVDVSLSRPNIKNRNTKHSREGLGTDLYSVSGNDTALYQKGARRW